jgi:putative tricarboxylic transport membrane protein
MSDIGGLLSGFGNAVSPLNLSMALIGAVLGTLVGVLPGLGPATTMAILLPLTVYLPPTGAIIMLAGIYYGAMYGGSTTSILINVPGEVSSVVTCLDGYKMKLAGRPGPALALCAIGSFIGGTAATAMLSLLAPPLAQVALSFGAPEYLGLAFFALASIVGLSGGSLLRGTIAGILGIVLSMVGWDPLSNITRLTFHSAFLSGLDVVPVFIGLFGMSEVMILMEQTGRASIDKIGSLLPSRDEFKRGLTSSVRGSLIGSVLGLIPGMVVAATAFLSYDFEKKISKYPEKFGTGLIEGVAAPESANNATAVAGMVPLMSLAIPTSPALAILLAAFMIFGLEPGPMLFIREAEFAWTVVASMYIGNIACLVLNLPLVGLWARLALIPRQIMAPLILGICVVGAYSARNLVLDIWVAIVFGLFGYYMRKRGWPQTPLVLGYILGPLFERSFRQTLSMADNAFLLLAQRPIAVALIAAGCAAIVFSIWRESFAAHGKPAREET